MFNGPNCNEHPSSGHVAETATAAEEQMACPSVKKERRRALVDINTALGRT